MKKYIYDTHVHTKESSKCGYTYAADYIDHYKVLGYTGIIITDHFYHGNTSIDRSLPWKEWIEQYCLGYEHAKAEGDKKGFQVFFGFEENFSHDEYLIYGLDKQWLLAHPELKTWTQREQFETITRYGGLVVQAHPFRVRDYVDEVNLHPFHCHAMEASNGGNPVYQDVIAYNYIKGIGKPMTSGSDMHNLAKGEAVVNGVAFDKPLTSIMDYVDAIKKGSGYELLIPVEKKQHITNEAIDLPIALHHYDETKEYVTLESLNLR